MTIFRISFISLLEIVNVVLSDPNIFLWIAASVADTAAINYNGIKTVLANGLSIFFNKGNPIFSNGPKSLPKNSPNCANLCKWVFDCFILSNELFAKALQSFEKCVLVNNSLCGNLCSSPTTFK